TARLESVRPGDLVLAERGPPIGRREIESVGRDDAALVHRVFGWGAQRDEASVANELRRVEARDQVDGLKRNVERCLEGLSERDDLGPAERPREAGEPEGHG